MVPYDVWSNEGFLELTPGNVIDHAFIIRRILELAERYHIREINFDRWGSVQVSTALQKEGLTLVQFGQGFKSMSAPTKQLLALVKQKRLAHDVHPVMKWCIGNLQVEIDDAENVKPSKKLARERIDLAVALVMSLDSAVVDDSKPKRWGFSQYLDLQERVAALE
jgi:phage terminase large subunit-like protein